MNLEDLKKPFPVDDLEWRIQRSGIGNKTGKPWAMVLCYITNRAIQDRLDEVCGPENWKNEYLPGPAGGVIAEVARRVRVRRPRRRELLDARRAHDARLRAGPAPAHRARRALTTEAARGLVAHDANATTSDACIIDAKRERGAA